MLEENRNKKMLHFFTSRIADLPLLLLLDSYTDGFGSISRPDHCIKEKMENITGNATMLPMVLLIKFSSKKTCLTKCVIYHFKVYNNTNNSFLFFCSGEPCFQGHMILFWFLVPSPFEMNALYMDSGQSSACWPDAELGSPYRSPNCG